MTENLELYKKYKPKRWEDMVGQEKVIESLRKDVLNGPDKIPTGFVFGGKPGTGKTSSAFIFAKAINCEHPTEDGNPCNECKTCKSIDNQVCSGVHYISMANNGGVEDVRRIVNDARVSQPIKKQIFILDEPQNISNSAFDAFLTPLESETMKSTFIFCTTEPEKIRQAVLSRCQVRNFRDVSNKDLGNHLIKISEKEGWLDKEDPENSIITPSIIRDILDVSDGSVRNAIGNLQSFISTGIVSTGSTEEILEALLDRKPIALYNISSKMQENGESYSASLGRMYKIFLGALIKSTSKENKKITKIEDKIIKKLKPMQILAILDILGNASILMTNKVVDYKIIYETHLMKILMKIPK